MAVEKKRFLRDRFPVTCHTDFVGEGSTFVALPGSTTNGVDHIMTAINRGATHIVVSTKTSISKDLFAIIESAKIRISFVEDVRQELAKLSAYAADFPARKMRIIGITGTKGKTTTAFLLESLFRAAGERTALISTVWNRIDTVIYETKFTTPQADYLQQFLKEAYVQGVTTVIMEVSAQAISLKRTYGIEFDAIVLTNFSQEHGEFYSTKEDYLQAKLAIIPQLKADGLLLVNQDCAEFADSVNMYKQKVNWTSFSFLSENVPFYAQFKESEFGSMYAIFDREKNERFEYFIDSLPGLYNGYNAVAAIVIARNFKIDPSVVQNGLEQFEGVPGRWQKQILSNGAIGIIDYAHNPASYDVVLRAMRARTDHLIVIFGAGGGRDKEKRSLMGKIAADYADHVVVTTDNPRDEDPNEIVHYLIKDIVDTNKLIIELDREVAIKKAYALSRAGSIIALLGKGPDEYQIIKSQVIPFKEREILLSLR